VSGQTLAEKILSEKSARRVKAGQLITSPVDLCTASDTTAPLAIRAFEDMCGGSAHARLAFPEKVVLVIDHAAPAPNERIANLHELMRRFARAQGCALFESGEGIIHHVVLEKNLAPTGSVVMGADSHTTTYGAWGSFAAGIGSTDAAAIWKTGCTWLKVPHSIRIELQGQLRPGVFAKDVMLHLLSRMGQQQANYQSIEFAGEAVEGLPFSERITLANMTAELGGKVGLVESRATLQADAGASYSKVIHVDVSALEPQVALPGSPAHGRALRDVEGQKVSLAFLGTCTNSRIEDLRIAASILKGKKIAQGVRLALVVPGSGLVKQQAEQEGLDQIFKAAGFEWREPGCSMCLAMNPDKLAPGERAASTSNRNFEGRQGRGGRTHLVSPAVAAATAVVGRFAAPSDLN